MQNHIKLVQQAINAKLPLHNYVITLNTLLHAARRNASRGKSPLQWLHFIRILDWSQVQLRVAEILEVTQPENIAGK